MLTNEEIAKRLEFHEGKRSESYYCSEGFLTQGVGHNLQTNPLTSEQKSKIKNLKKWSDAEIRMVLFDDIDQCKTLISQIIKGFDEFDDERQYAILDMCFQLGVLGVSKFKKMLEAMRLGDWEKASEECLNSRYAKQTPKRAERIARLIKTGVWKI